MILFNCLAKKKRRTLAINGYMNEDAYYNSVKEFARMIKYLRQRKVLCREYEQDSKL